uniref:Restriction endonuclease n=1 Tax=Candidatus Kentrum sp. FM TaxID=2126340 RepID=A0A450X201_9GAMM|nr:MAG: Putative restriction endonuclease [Candidatus Kentron sp. FM]VFK23334.1 MAG: Putative restriction endonuclease [Candidatus Kentron sp. FM]
MSNKQKIPLGGPFAADQISNGERYELSHGHRIYCAPAGESHARHNVTGASLLDSDPAVEWSGVDAGFTPKPDTLCAPDVSVAPPPPPGKKGWIPGVPPLAVEYADRGQNETDLKIKIKELLAAGTRYVWVVRLMGPQRVEVHTPNAPMRLLSATDTLEAPGILRNRVPVHALFDREEAHRVTLRNLLQREGYEDLEAVRQEALQEGEARGKAKGKIEGGLVAQADALLGILAARGIRVDTHARERIRHCRDPEQLGTWLTKAAVADSLEEVF